MYEVPDPCGGGAGGLDPPLAHDVRFFNIGPKAGCPFFAWRPNTLDPAPLFKNPASAPGMVCMDYEWFAYVYVMDGEDVGERGWCPGRLHGEYLLLVLLTF